MLDGHSRDELDISLTHRKAGKSHGATLGYPGERRPPRIEDHP